MGKCVGSMPWRHSPREASAGRTPKPKVQPDPRPVPSCRTHIEELLGGGHGDPAQGLLVFIIHHLVAVHTLGFMEPEADQFQGASQNLYGGEQDALPGQGAISGCQVITRWGLVAGTAGTGLVELWCCVAMLTEGWGEQRQEPSEVPGGGWGLSGVAVSEHMSGWAWGT